MTDRRWWVTQCVVITTVVGAAAIVSAELTSFNIRHHDAPALTIQAPKAPDVLPRTNATFSPEGVLIGTNGTPLERRRQLWDELEVIQRDLDRLAKECTGVEGRTWVARKCESRGGNLAKRLSAVDEKWYALEAGR